MSSLIHHRFRSKSLSSVRDLSTSIEAQPFPILQSPALSTNATVSDGAAAANPISDGLHDFSRFTPRGYGAGNASNLLDAIPVSYPDGPADTMGCTARSGARLFDDQGRLPWLERQARRYLPCIGAPKHEEILRFRQRQKERERLLVRADRRVAYDPRPRHKRTFIMNNSILRGMHLDKRSMWLNARQTQVLYVVFSLLDYDDNGLWDNITFHEFMRNATDLTRSRLRDAFDLIDKGAQGQICFEEFYFFICLMIASNNGDQKEFMLKHSRMVFELLDADMSSSISAKEFTNVGWLFNLKKRETRKLFREFDLSGDQELDYSEFQFFAQAALGLS